MTSESLLDLIQRDCGPVRMTKANGVVVAAVPLFSGVAIGCGSNAAAALYDLHCDLYGTTRRLPVPTDAWLCHWERARRKSEDETRTRKPA